MVTQAESMSVKHLGTMRTPLGEFEIGKTLGEGSYGKVKLITNIKTKDQLAVKIVKRYIAPNPEKGTKGRGGKTFEQRILREANLTRFLRHTHIVPLKDCRITKSHFYLFHEYIPGSQLTDRIGRGGLSAELSSHYFRQIIDGIQYCHNNFVVHRDIKVENIMIDNNNCVKIIDFGLANFFDEKNALKTFCGSLQYSAPEIMRGDPYIGPEVDIWSIGVVLFAMLTGTLPFDDPRSPGAWENVMNGKIKWPANMEKIPTSLITRLLEPKPKLRIKMSEIARDPFIFKHQPGQEPIDESKFRILPKHLDLSIIAEMASCMFQSEHSILMQIEEELKKGQEQGAGVLVNNSPLVSVYLLIAATKDQLAKKENTTLDDCQDQVNNDEIKPLDRKGSSITQSNEHHYEHQILPTQPKPKASSSLQPSSSVEQSRHSSKVALQDSYRVQAQAQEKSISEPPRDYGYETAPANQYSEQTRPKRQSMFETYYSKKESQPIADLNKGSYKAHEEPTDETAKLRNKSIFRRNSIKRRPTVHKSFRKPHFSQDKKSPEDLVEPKLLPIISNQHRYLKKILNSYAPQYNNLSPSQSARLSDPKKSARVGLQALEGSRAATLPSLPKNSALKKSGAPWANQIFKALDQNNSESETSDDSLPQEQPDFVKDGKVSLFKSPNLDNVNDNDAVSNAKLSLIKKNETVDKSRFELVPGVPQVSISDCLRATVIQIAKANISVVSDRFLDALASVDLDYTWLKKAFDFMVIVPRSALYQNAQGQLLARVEIVHVTRAKSSAILLQECSFDPNSDHVAPHLLPLDSLRLQTYFQSLL